MVEEASDRRGFRVLGRVQGVGFRWTASRRAGELGLRGSIRNCPDGSVEIHAEGPRAAVERFAAWLAEGPGGARVDRVEEIRSTLPLPREGFTIVH